MSGEMVLVADGDPRSLRLLELALRRAGFAVESAADGGQAMRKLLETPVQAAVCDVALSEPDGLALCRAARAHERLAGIPFLLVGALDPAAKARAVEAGADDYLAKPVLLKELVQRVRHLLERRRLSDPGPPAALTGSVRDLGLLDLFRSLESWRKDAVVRCEKGGQLARVWVRGGEVIDAELGPVSGDVAFWRLMTWEDGEFRVDFAEAGKRERRIHGGTQGALLEAMRRVEELARVAQALPMDTQLTVDVARLEARLADLPDEINAVLRIMDGGRALRAALDLSPSDDLSTVGVVQQLIADGILRPASRPASLQHWVSAPPPGSAPAAPAAPRIVHFPPLRGMRRERLRREAEQARAKLASGEPVRLHHVVELPPRGQAEMLGELRRVSPAVGEAAKTFTADAQLARVLIPDPARATEPPPIAPVAATTPPPGVGRATDARPRRRWAWFFLATVALTLSWVLRPQPRTERRDAPWLETKGLAAGAEVTAAGVAAGPTGYAEAVGRGNDLFRQGKYGAAASEYRKALSLRRDAVPVLISLGDAHLEADQPRSALEPLERAARLDPTSARAQLLLGTTYHSLGRIRDAVKAYRRYLELEPTSEFAKDVQVILANLGPPG
jgi:CheY-like chemotaxis protein/tetratricopeptide (TPR) repeat protein